MMPIFMGWLKVFNKILAFNNNTPINCRWCLAAQATISYSSSAVVHACKEHFERAVGTELEKEKHSGKNKRPKRPTLVASRASVQKDTQTQGTFKVLKVVTFILRLYTHFGMVSRTSLLIIVVFLPISVMNFAVISNLPLT